MQIKFAFALGLFVSLYIIVLHLPQLTLKINVYVFFQRISGICPQGQRNGHGCRRNHRRCVRKNRFIASQRHPDAAHRRPHRQYGLLVAAARHQQGARPLLESDTRSDRRNRVGTAESVPAEPIWWNYGAFIQQCVDFAILAFCVFLMVKMMNKLMKKKQEAAPAPVPEPSKEELLLTEIRDLLREQKK